MEFLRFASSIPGSYWGCCCFDVIQCFSVHPDDPASIQIVSGDGGEALGDMFAGKTYREIFWTRIRTGTFDNRDMPNHGFLLVITEEQIETDEGQAWLEIFAEAGFEFIRVVDNSVYSSDRVINEPGIFTGSSNKNYLFGLFRNIAAAGTIANPFEPPEEWKRIVNKSPALVEYMPEAVALDLAKRQQEFQFNSWHAMPGKTFYTEAELEANRVPVIYAGQRSMFPQEEKSVRLQKQEENPHYRPSSGNPFDDDF